MSLLTVAALCFQIAVDFRNFARSTSITEPSTAAFSPNNPCRYQVVALRSLLHTHMDSAARPELPVALLDDLEFFPIAHYAPTHLRHRLFYVSWADADGIDFNGTIYSKLRGFVTAPATVSLRPVFTSEHTSFLAYGGPRTFFKLSYLVDHGANVKILKTAGTEFLACVSLGPATPD